MGTRHGSMVWPLLALLLVGPAAAAGSRERCAVELIRLDLDRHDASAATPFALVVHVPSGRRFVKADCAVRDGAVLRRPDGRARAAGAALGRLGVELATRRLSDELGVGLELLTTMLLPQPAVGPPAPRRGTTIALRDAGLARHAGYVVTIVELETTPLTRVECERIVTRRDRSRGRAAATGRRRSREAAAPALAPHDRGPVLGRRGLDELLRGRYPFPDPIH